MYGLLGPPAPGSATPSSSAPQHPAAASEHDAARAFAASSGLGREAQGAAAPSQGAATSARSSPVPGTPAAAGADSGARPVGRARASGRRRASLREGTPPGPAGAPEPPLAAERPPPGPVHMLVRMRVAPSHPPKGPATPCIICHKLCALRWTPELDLIGTLLRAHMSKRVLAMAHGHLYPGYQPHVQSCCIRRAYRGLHAADACCNAC